MNAIVICADAERLEQWSSELLALGHQPQGLPALGAPALDAAICVWVCPDSYTKTEILDAIGKIRTRLPAGTPVLIAGAIEPALVEELLSAGATDVLPGDLKTDDLANRLLVASHWARTRASGAHRSWTAQQEAETQRRLLASLAVGLAHDFNNLLSAIQGNVDLSLMNPALATDLRYNLEQIGMASQRAAQLTRQVLEYSRPEEGGSSKLDLVECVRRLRRPVRDCAGGRSVEFHLDKATGWVKMNFSLLALTLVVLAESPEDAGAPEPRDLDIVTATAGPGVAVLEIRGVSMTPQREQLLESIGESLAAYGARLSYPEVHVARITFQAAATDDSGPGAATPAPAARGACTILLIDDEDAVRAATQRLLRREGYTVLEAGSGEEGLNLFRNVGGMLDAVILDLNLPGMEGGEVLHHLRNLRPEIRVLVWSGLPEEMARKQMNGFNDVTFVEKPAQLAEFPAMLSRILGRV